MLAILVLILGIFMMSTMIVFAEEDITSPGENNLVMETQDVYKIILLAAKNIEDEGMRSELIDDVLRDFSERSPRENYQSLERVALEVKDTITSPKERFRALRAIAEFSAHMGTKDFQPFFEEIAKIDDNEKEISVYVDCAKIYYYARIFDKTEDMLDRAIRQVTPQIKANTQPEETEENNNLMEIIRLYTEINKIDKALRIVRESGDEYVAIEVVDPIISRLVQDKDYDTALSVLNEFEKESYEGWAIIAAGYLQDGDSKNANIIFDNTEAKASDLTDNNKWWLLSHDDLGQLLKMRHGLNTGPINSTINDLMVNFSDQIARHVNPTGDYSRIIECVKDLNTEANWKTALLLNLADQFFIKGYQEAGEKLLNEALLWAKQTEFYKGSLTGQLAAKILYDFHRVDEAKNVLGQVDPELVDCFSDEFWDRWSDYLDEGKLELVLANLDIVKRWIEKSKSQEEKIDTLFELVNAYRSLNINGEVLLLVQEVVNLANRQGSIDIKIDTYSKAASVYFDQNLETRATQTLNKAYELYKQSDKKEQPDLLASCELLGDQEKFDQIVKDKIDYSVQEQIFDLVLLAVGCMRSGQTEKAVDIFQIALERNDSNVSTHSSESNDISDLNDVGDIIDSPDFSALIKLAMANEYFYQGDYQHGGEILADIHESAIAFLVIPSWCGYGIENDNEQIISYCIDLTKVCETQKEADEVLSALGFRVIMAGWYDKAFESIQKISSYYDKCELLLQLANKYTEEKKPIDVKTQQFLQKILEDSMNERTKAS